MVKQRKADHIDISLNENVNADYNYWDDIRFYHKALPEIDVSEIETSIEIFGKKLSAPIIISAITGGYDKAEFINHNLAVAAGRIGVGLGIGSQRAAIEKPALAHTYEVIKGKNVPLVIGNIGAPQLIPQEGKKAFGVEECRSAMEMVDADILAIHMNYLQEIVQPEGDLKARGCLNAIRKVAAELPVLAKETGAGISREMAEVLRDAGVKGIDVGGLGGTSFSAVEYYRARKGGEESLERLGKTFWNWGIPTPVSLSLADVGLPLVATGGIRNGLDVARSVSLGANSAGMAKRLLEAATRSADSVEKELRLIVEELKGAMFLTGCVNIRDLRNVCPIITGPMAPWMDAARLRHGSVRILNGHS
ncbi:MAG: type 2 isopentenyl-diphosphate Delta-isomerase [Gammaproteobacteria bacterium]|nr:type 2 isopentenyl-diphosphate Delta-isomerase [Gammaproteobacteria bacterium]